MNMKKFYARFKICSSSNILSITTLVTTLVSLISLFITFFSIQTKAWWVITLFLVAVLLLIVLLCKVVTPFFFAKIYDKNSQENEINKYMENLYKNATGKIIISTTGGMNWATTKIIEILEQKAQNSSVVIFIPKANLKTNRLAAAGAKIITDQTCKITPNLNFSIINSDSDDAMIAIGRPMKNDIHGITEYEAKSDVIVVAKELSRLLESI